MPFTLKQGNKTLSMVQNQRHYVIGFKNALTARKVQYSMHPEPKLTLIRDTDIYLKDDFDAHGYDLSLTIDVKATLFIPKCVGSTLHPMNDGGFHMQQYNDNEFLLLPVEKQLGLILPYELQEENEDEFIFKTCVIDPISL